MVALDILLIYTVFCQMSLANFISSCGLKRLFKRLVKEAFEGEGFTPVILNPNLLKC
tara:strand:- start:117 stop:287 length:171 start_codon:yes stop_codon:yes gene_type:complete